MPLLSRQVKYLRLRQAHPEMTPADAMELASQEDEELEAPAPEVPAAGGVKLDVPDEEPEPPGAIELEGYEPPPSEPPLVQALGQPPAPAPTVDAEADKRELAAAKKKDSRSRFLAAMDLAGRQLLAGLTRTPVSQGPGAAPARAPGVLKSQEARRQALKDHLLQERQRRLDDSQLQVNEARVLESFRKGGGDELDRRYKDWLMQKGGVELGLRKEEIDRKKADAKLKAEEQRRKAGAAGKAKAEKDLEEQTKHLAKELGGDPARISAMLDRLEAKIAGKEDVPGIGSIEGRLPDIFTSDEGLGVRNEAKAIADALLKMQSGAGVSDTERKAMYRLYGIDGGDERAFREGLVRLRAALEAEVKAKSAGVKPEAVKKYRERGGVAAEDLAKSTPATKTVGGGTVKLRRASDGAVAVVSAAAGKALLAKGGYEAVP